MKITGQPCQDKVFWTVELEESDKVLPCPFCGETHVHLENTWTASYWIRCGRCTAEIHGDYGCDLVDGNDFDAEPHMASARSALQAWNARVGAAQ